MHSITVEMATELVHTFDCAGMDLTLKVVFLEWMKAKRQVLRICKTIKTYLESAIQVIPLI